MSERLAYRFGPLERRGILGPVRGGQALCLAVGAIAAVLVLDSAPNAEGAFISTALFAGAAGICTVPAGGRTLEEWAPVFAVFAVRSFARQTRFRSRVAAAGVRVGTVARGGPLVRHQPPDPPPAVRDIRIVEATCSNRSVGVLTARRGRLLTAVLACRAGAFALLDADAQERRLARWGQVLASAASSPIARLQWVERTAPAQGDELARWVASGRDPAVPLRGTAMIDSYLELIGTTASVSHDHEILLAVQVDTARIRGLGRDSHEAVLLEQADRVAQGLEAAHVSVLGALGSAQLARVLRTAFDPYARGELTALQTADPGRPGLLETSAWPLACNEAWDQYRADGAVHATFWVGEWPRADVSPMFLDSLLAHSNVVRTVSVTFEPIAPSRSARDAEAAITRDRADRELRRRFGQSQTARQRLSEEATARREAELAAGHGEVRLSGFVTVSGRDDEELRRACAEVTEHAARAQLELHRMYGQQADAFTFTLPLCRGLR